jgi:hypothetical protein
MTKSKLKADDYSPMELTIFDVLPLGQSMTSDDLLKRIYRRRAEPFHSRIVVNTAVRHLALKMDRNREPYRIRRVKRKGERLIETSLVKR